jgi:large subunit ribosomal protein L2
MGKRPLVRRRGRGGLQFRAVTTGKLNSAKYPNFTLSEQHEGQFGLKSEIESGNIISIQNIPDGTIVCNVEKHFGDGGKIVKSAGGNATVFSHSDDGVILKLPSGKFATLNPKNRAMIGTLAGGGVGDRPLMSAGGTWRRFRSKGRKFPIVRGVAQAAYVHPHGGGRHQHVGQSSTVSRNAPPGAKVGSIAARKTGRARIKERK